MHSILNTWVFCMCVCFIFIFVRDTFDAKERLEQIKLLEVAVQKSKLFRRLFFVQELIVLSFIDDSVMVKTLLSTGLTAHLSSPTQYGLLETSTRRNGTKPRLVLRRTEKWREEFTKFDVSLISYSHKKIHHRLKCYSYYLITDWIQIRWIFWTGLYSNILFAPVSSNWIVRDNLI